MRTTKVLSEEVQTAIRGSLVYTLFLHDHHAQILAILVKTRTPLSWAEIEYLEKAYKRTQSR